MSSIDERIISMQFDNSQFEKGVQETLKSLDDLKKGLNLGDSTEGLESLSKLGDSFSLAKIAKAADFLKDRFSFAGEFIHRHVESISRKIESVGKQLVRTFTIDPIKSGLSEYETQIGAIQTILANTQSKGSTLEDVNSALDELNHYADKTIYNFTEMTRNIGTFTAAGVDLDTSVSAIKGIANLAAVSGSTSQQASTAMYQLSQALASGTVKLQDWNSVVNAGMGGQVFQDLLKKVAKQHGTDVDKLIKKHGSFRETLSKTGWLTTEVLTEALSIISGLSKEEIKAMGYTEEEAEELAKLAETAEDAATKVKTFSQLFDTLKEAAQSGWTQTWEYIIGDFEEAKAFLSDLSDMFNDFINAGSERRNSVFQEWHDLGGRADLVQGIKDIVESILYIADKIRTAFESVFGALNSSQLLAVSSWVKDLGASLKSFLGIQEKASEAVGNGVSSMIDGITGGVKDATKALGELDEELKKGSKGDGVKALQEELIGLGYSLDKFGADGIFGSETKKALEEFQKANGLEVTGVFDAATKAKMEALKAAKKELKPLDEVISNVEENMLSRLPAGFSELYRIVKGVFSIFHLLAKAIGFVVNVVKALIKPFTPLVRVVISIAAVIGDAITAFDKWVEESGIFTSAIEAINKVLEPVHAFIQKVADAIIDFFGFEKDVDGAVKKVEDFGAVWETVKSKIENVAIFQKIGEGFRFVKNKVASAWPTIKSVFTGLFQSVKDLFSGKISIADVGVKIGKAFSTAFESVKTFVKDRFPGLFNFLSDIFAKISPTFSGFGEKIKTVFEGVAPKVASAFHKIGDIFSGIWETLKSFFSGKIDFSEVKDRFVTAIKSLFGSIKDAISKINLGDVWRSIKDFFGNIGTKIGDLFGQLLDLIFPSAKAESADAIESVSEAGGFLETVKEKLGGVWESVSKWLSGAWETIKGLGPKIGKGGIIAAIIAIIGGIAASGSITNIISAIKQFKEFKESLKKNADDNDGGSKPSWATGLIAFAVAVGAVTAAIYVISTLDTNKLIQGVSVIGGIIALIVIIALVCKSIQKKSQDMSPEAVTRFAGIMTALGAAFTGIGIAFLAIAASVWILSKVDPNNFFLAIGAVGALAVMLGIFMVLVAKFGGSKFDLSGFADIGIVLAEMAGIAFLLSNWDWSSFIDGAAKLAIVMGLLAAFMILVGRFGGSEFNLEGINSIGTTVATLVGVLFLLNKLNWEDFFHGAIMLGVIMAELAFVLIAVGKADINENTKGAINALRNIILVLVGALVILSKMDTGDLIKSTIALGVIMLSLSAVLKSIGGMTSDLKKSAGILVQLIGVAVVISVLVLAVKVLGKTNGSELAKGLIGLVVIVIALKLLLSTISKMKVEGSWWKSLIALGAMVVAVAAFALIVTYLGKLKDSVLLKGLLAVGAIILGIFVLSKVLSKVKATKMLSGAAGIAGAVAIMALIFTGLLALLGAIDNWTSGGFTSLLKKGGAVLQAVMDGMRPLLDNLGLLMILVGGSILAGKVGGLSVIAGGAGIGGAISAITLIFTGLLSLLGAINEWSGGGILDLLDSGEQVLAKLGTSLGTFLGSVKGAFDAAATNAMSGAMGSFGDAVSSFATNVSGFSTDYPTLDEDTDSAIKIATKIKEFFDSLVDNTPVFGALLTFVEAAAAEKFLSSMIKFGMTARSFANQISGFATSFPTLPEDTQAAVDVANQVNAFFKGITGDGEDGGNPLWGALASWIGGYTTSNFLDNMSNFADAIDEYAGKISGFATKYPDLGDDTTAAIGNAEQVNTFFNSIGGDGSSENPVWDAISSWLDGYTVSTFNQNLSDFAEAIDEYAGVITGFSTKYPNLDADTTAATGAASIVNTFFGEIPNPPAWEAIQTWLGGDSKVESFSADLRAFGSAITEFAVWAKLTSWVNSNLITDTSTITAAAGMVSDLFDNLPDEAPKWSLLTGWSTGYSPSQFSSDLVSFGSSITQFAAWSLVAMLINPNLIADTSSLVTAAEKVSGLFSGLDGIESPDWGILGAFVKDYSPDEFIKDMGKFGSMAATFATNIKDIDTDGSFEQKAGIAIGIADSMAQFFEKIPDYDIEQKTSAFDKLLHGENKTESFMSYMGEFAEEVGELDTKFGENFIGENVVAKVDSAVTVLNKMATLMTVLNSDDVYNFDYNADAFWGLKQVIGELSGQLVYLDETTADINPAKIVKISRAIANLVDSVMKMGTTKIDSSNVDIAIEQIGKLANSSFEDEFKGSGESAGAAFAAGVRSANDGSATKAAQSIGSSAIAALRKQENLWKAAGRYVMDGFKLGLQDRAPNVVTAAEKIGQSIIDGLNKGSGVNSPSKYARETGKFIDIGLASGLNDYSYAAVTAAKSVGSDVISATSGLLANVSDAIASGVDGDPVIRPVVDMSSVESSAKSIRGMLSGQTGMRIDAERSSTMAQKAGSTLKGLGTNQNGSKSDNGVSRSTDNSVNFSGSTFYIRSENDIHALASEIANLTHQQQRAFGGS